MRNRIPISNEAYQEMLTREEDENIKLRLWVRHSLLVGILVGLIVGSLGTMVAYHYWGA